MADLGSALGYSLGTVRWDHSLSWWDSVWHSWRRFKENFDLILGTMGGIAGLSTCQLSAKVIQNLFSIIWHFITLKILSYGSLNGM